MADYNLQDPAKIEAIRRKPHEYVVGEGRHGQYVEKPYIHQEYPKIMDKTPVPTMKDFKGKPDAQILFDSAMKEWDRVQRESTVHNKSQEAAWIEEHAGDPVVAIADRQYPKTMDRTPAPNPSDFNTLEDLREARAAWQVQAQASIVKDKDEEELWIREYQQAAEPNQSEAASQAHRSGKKKVRAA